MSNPVKIVIGIDYADGKSSETITFEGEEGMAFYSRLAQAMEKIGSEDFHDGMKLLQEMAKRRGSLRKGCVNCGYVGPQA